MRMQKAMHAFAISSGVNGTCVGAVAGVFYIAGVNNVSPPCAGMPFAMSRNVGTFHAIYQLRSFSKVTSMHRCLHPSIQMI